MSPATTRLYSPQDPDAIPEALRVLESGGVVAFPTDTVYGVGVSAFDASAVTRLYEIKGRSRQKALPLLIASRDHLDRVAGELSPLAKRLSEAFWPGPLTLIVAKGPSLAEGISPDETVGVRVPDHPLALALLAAAGPLATSSANLSGQPNACTAEEVASQLGGRVQLILDGGTTPGGTPSTVVDCTSGEPRVLREGPLSASQIAAAAS